MTRPKLSLDINTIISGIYQIKFKLSDNIYIGSAVNLRVRKANHIHHLRKGTHHNSHLQNVWNKYGEENYEFQILITCHPEMCIWYEQQFLDQWKPEYNINPTAGSQLGVKRSEKSRQKMSISAKNRPPISDETRKKIGEITRNFSKETLEKIRQTRIGHPVSEGTKKKIGDSNRGKVRSESVIEKMRQIGRNQSEVDKQRLRTINIGRKDSLESKLRKSEAAKRSWKLRKEGV